MAVLKIIHFIDSASGTCKPYPLYSSQAVKKNEHLQDTKIAAR